MIIQLLLRICYSLKSKNTNEITQKKINFLYKRKKNHPINSVRLIRETTLPSNHQQIIIRNDVNDLKGGEQVEVSNRVIV